MNETRSSSGEPQSLEVFINSNSRSLRATEPQKNMIMKLNLILKVNVEWHCDDDGMFKRVNTLSLLAALFSIVASVLTISCH